MQALKALCVKGFCGLESYERRKTHFYEVSDFLACLHLPVCWAR